jgi:hypothetical protein
MKKKSKIKARPLCAGMRRVAQEAAARAKQEGQNPELAKHAAVIRRTAKRLIKDIVEIGRRLSIAKKLVGHGNWAGWLKEEFDWSEGTALNFMRVFEFVEKYKSKNFADLKTFEDLLIAPSALYTLARSSTPEEVRNEIIERAAAGENITHSTVQEVLAARVAARVQEALTPPADETITIVDASSLLPTANEAVTTEAVEESPLPTAAEGESDPAEQLPAEADADSEGDPAEQPRRREGGDWTREGTRRWFSDLIRRARAAIADGELATTHLDPETRQNILDVIDPTLLSTVRKGCEGSIKVRDFLEHLEASRQDEAPDEAAA